MVTDTSDFELKMMDIARSAMSELFPSKDLFNVQFVVQFSGKFTPYNAQIKYVKLPNKEIIEFRLSKTWMTTDTQLVVGLMQSLLFKLFSKRLKPSSKKTLAMDMYEIFIKRVGNYAPITKADPILVGSFERINSKFFDGVIHRPNLEWGTKTFRKLGHYNYHTDTIMIARTLESRMDLVDYVMYHEMLHKKHKFYFKNGRSFHHHTAFRSEEAQYPNATELERELALFVSKEKRKFTFENEVKTAKISEPSAAKSLISWFLE